MNNKQYRIKVAQENWHEHIPSIVQRYPSETSKCIYDTIYHKDTRNFVTPYVEEETDSKFILEVRCQDTLDATWDEVQAGYRPLVLNMASDRVPGGGYRKGSMAQEEELFRRTTLSLSLENMKYPLQTYTAIYSPKVLVFRDIDYNIQEWKECFWIDVISTVAIRNPKLQSNRLTHHDEKVTLDKIRGIFKIGIAQKHDCLILSALGCGAFHNPPEHVAELFKQVINEYGNQFKKIVFAIIGDNFNVFHKVLIN
jgi:uncharacterized protein (TIGR02452 family)